MEKEETLSVRRNNPIRDTSRYRGQGRRKGRHYLRRIESPAVPTGINRETAPQRSRLPHPKKSLPKIEAQRRMRFKKDLMKRYDTNERNRRRNLTNNQHHSHTGKVGSEGFRNQTTIKGVPSDRTRSPFNWYLGKRRQYAYQNEFPQSQKHYWAAGMKMSIFRNKRTVYQFQKKQPVTSQITMK